MTLKSLQYKPPYNPPASPVQTDLNPHHHHLQPHHHPHEEPHHHCHEEPHLPHCDDIVPHSHRSNHIHLPTPQHPLHHTHRPHGEPHQLQHDSVQGSHGSEPYPGEEYKPAGSLKECSSSNIIARTDRPSWIKISEKLPIVKNTGLVCESKLEKELFVETVPTKISENSEIFKLSSRNLNQSFKQKLSMFQRKEVEEKYGQNAEKKLFGTKVPPSSQKTVKKCSKFRDGQNLTPNSKRKGSTPSTPTRKTHAKGGEESRKTYSSLKKKKLAASKIDYFETLRTGESKPTLSLMALSVMK